MSGKDLLFFTNVIHAGRQQAYLVDLLQTKAESEQIKALGSALASTQKEENEQLAKLAAKKGWEVSTKPTSAQKKVGAELAKHTGSEFDKAVLDKLATATKASVTAYEAAAQSTDADIKSFATQMLPLARQKLQFTEKMTGAGKAAAQLFRTGTTPKPDIGTEAKPIPPPITN